MPMSLPFTQAQIPVEGATIISRQGPRPRRRTWHNGIDLGGVPVGTPVHPIAPGVVEAICVSGLSCCGYGNAVLVRHGDDLLSFYAHLHDVQVTVGQEVDTETVLGGLGKTFGQRNRETDVCEPRSMIEHLHLEIQHAGFPFSADDFEARYDVLQVLASAGIAVASGGALVPTEPFDYEEPALVAARGKSVEGYHGVIVGDPSLLPRRSPWPVVGVLALTAAAVVASVWVGGGGRRER
jgi:murein DD-endopeptidase MepM/ murein hydrolase activator NlpD